MKFNRFLHPKELPQRIFLISCKTTWLRAVKNWILSIFMPKINLITLKMVFALECQTRRTTFSNTIFYCIHTHQVLSSKDVPYFCQFQLSCFGRYTENSLIKCIYWTIKVFWISFDSPWKSTTVIKQIKNHYIFDEKTNTKFLIFRT